MKFSTDANVNGTSLQGYITTDYATLVETFGSPSYGPNDTTGDKVTCEWALLFADGTVATIYDWKEYETPMGRHRWHIGGTNYQAVERVYDVMGATV